MALKHWKRQKYPNLNINTRRLSSFVSVLSLSTPFFLSTNPKNTIRNDVDTYYNKLLAGESGVALFDASKFPTRFAGQIHNFSSGGYIDGKSDRRLDDSLRYFIVAGKKALKHA